jgi:5'-3' exonuclease
MPPVDLSNHILAVDASYAVFHKFYAIKRWKQHNETSLTPPGECLTDNELLCFGDRFRQMLCQKMRDVDVPPTNVILLLDCPRADIWRMRLHPEYKGTRLKPADLPPNLFAFFRETLVDDLVDNLGVKAIGIDTAEADDVAAVLTDWALDKGAPGVTIITGDCDLAQLVRDKVRVIDMTGACLLDRATAKCGCICDAATYLTHKILQGDKGDNIAPVKPRVGPKTALKMIQRRELLDAFMADPDNKRRFEFNETLIDLKKIPAPLYDEIKSQLDKLMPAV